MREERAGSVEVKLRLAQRGGVGNEDSEHDGLDKPIYEEFRLRQEVLGLKEAFRTKSEKN